MRKPVHTALNKERKGQVDVIYFWTKSCPLSKRELEILSYAARGLQYREVADVLGISWQTIRSHMTTIYDRLSVPDKTAAVVLAIYKGWLIMGKVESKDEIIE